ncbi:hypothetical protein PPSIR1_09600 [Plesiocystis pacifica SIR-1]|uniref:Uncharacterized protein n=1 Tax=Plesiocystis pacifica SIR-1 TaxID=391625 RepID=A6G9C6_9BACT|nr:hypothetical protein PPSIR1_09600 [Plesiocystis pacifica SIR-1]
MPAPGEVKQPAADIPAPGEVKPPVADIPAPGEVSKPADIPAPGEVSKPADIPAPGEVAAPAAAAPAPEPEPQGDIAEDPFSGGVSFDPNAGIIDDVGGEIKPKGGVGLPIFAAVIGIVVGMGLGWMAHKANDGGMRFDAAIAKAKTIEEKINEIEKTRALIALKIGDAEEALTAKKGDDAVAALDELEPTFIELGDIFGWQMAAMDPAVVKKIFDLAEANNSMQIDVGILKGWVTQYKDVLTERISGPSSYVVIANPQAGGSVLAEYVAAICEDIPDPRPEDFKPDSLKKCDKEKDDILKAKAYLVRTEIGGETRLVPGGQAFYLTPTGAMYNYAIGQSPNANAKGYFDLRMGKLKGELDAMVKLKDGALEGVANYTKNPNLDGGG